MRADSLEKQLSNRPKPEDLIKEGILNGMSHEKCVKNECRCLIC